MFSGRSNDFVVQVDIDRAVIRTLHQGLYVAVFYPRDEGRSNENVVDTCAVVGFSSIDTGVPTWLV